MISYDYDDIWTSFHKGIALIHAKEGRDDDLYFMPFWE